MADVDHAIAELHRHSRYIMLMTQPCGEFRNLGVVGQPGSKEGPGDGGPVDGVVHGGGEHTPGMTANKG